MTRNLWSLPDDLWDVAESYETPDLSGVDLSSAERVAVQLVTFFEEVAPELADTLGQARVEGSGSSVVLVYAPRMYEVFESSIDSETLSRAADFLGLGGVEFQAKKLGMAEVNPDEVEGFESVMEYADKQEGLREGVLNHPVVREAIDIFEPDSVDVSVKVDTHD